MFLVPSALPWNVGFCGSAVRIGDLFVKGERWCQAGVTLVAPKVDDAARATYLRWILEKDFPSHVHELCSQVLKLSVDEFDRDDATELAQLLRHSVVKLCASKGALVVTSKCN